MAQPLQAGAEFTALKADTAFQAAPPDEQFQYLLEDYLPKQDPEFAKAPRNEQIQYINEVVLPQAIEIKPAHLQKPAAAPASQSISNPLATTLLKMAYPTTRAWQGISMGYLDQPAKAIEARLRQQNQFGLPEQVMGGAYELTSAIAPTLLADKGISKLPLLAKLPQAAQLGLSGAATAGLYKQPNDQRLQSAALGGVLGTAAPMIPKLIGGVTKTFNPNTVTPFKLPKLEPLPAKPQPNMLINNPQYQRLRVGKRVPDKDMTLKGTAQAYKWLKNKAAATAKTVNIPELERLLKDVDILEQSGHISPRQGKMLKAKIQKDVDNAQKKGQQQKGQSDAQGQKASDTTQKKPGHNQSQKALNATIQKAIEATGKNTDEIREILKKPRSQEAKELRAKLTEINPNLPDVMRSDYDPVTGVGRQIPDTRLQSFDDVKDAIPKALMGKAEKLQQAFEQDKIIRVEYQAEITGRTDKAVKITRKGKVKTERTDASIRGWFKNDKGIGVYLDNENGHPRMYYLTETPEGSVITTVGQITDRPAFKGLYAKHGVVDGTFNVDDLLNRKEAKEGILTSEAMRNADALKEFYKSDVFKALPPETQKLLREVQKKGRFDDADFDILKASLNKDMMQLKRLCSLFGFKVK